MGESDQADQANQATQGRTGMSRRRFITTAAGAGAAFTIVPRHVLGRGFQAPSDLVNVAIAGVGGMGANNLRAVFSQNIVAICDVDSTLVDSRLAQWSQGGGRPQGRRQNQEAAAAPPGAPQWQEWGGSKKQQEADARFPRQDGDANLKKFVAEIPRIQRYADYREMLEKQKDIDALIVATPDHMHAVISSAAMDLGKHVYVQKPMAWCVSEARHLAKRAAETKVQAQCGNQRHSGDEHRRGVDYLKSGVIGDVSQVHVWTNRPIWPQGLPRPKPFTVDPSQRLSQQMVLQAAMGAVKGSATPPSTLSWDLFLGVAPVVEYDPIYHPFNWRGWVDWGQGALGDMGAHLIDFPVWGLDLGLPTSVETTSTPFNDITFPLATMTHYDFPAKGKRGAVRLTWYDGGFQPPTPPELGEHARLAQSGGILYIGSKGKLLCNEGMPARLLPASLHNSFGAPKEQLARVPNEEHEMNWIRAIKGQDTLSSPFSYAAHLHEIMLLGLVSLRARSKITYDGANMRVTTPDSANQYLTREYRAPYRLQSARESA
jgi:predicted dehydrogenase